MRRASDGAKSAERSAWLGNDVRDLADEPFVDANVTGSPQQERMSRQLRSPNGPGESASAHVSAARAAIIRRLSADPATRLVRADVPRRARSARPRSYGSSAERSKTSRISGYGRPAVRESISTDVL
jgi:hypothetical protein